MHVDNLLCKQITTDDDEFLAGSPLPAAQLPALVGFLTSCLWQVARHKISFMWLQVLCYIIS